MPALKLGCTAAVLSLCCATTTAQSKYLPASPPKPTAGVPAPPAGRVPSAPNWVGIPSASPQARTIEFEFKGQKVSVTLGVGRTVRVKVDGVPVPSRQIQRGSKTATAIDADGEVLAKITYPSPWSAKSPYDNWTLGRRAAMGLSVVAVPPAVAAHIDVDPKSAVLVKRVTEGNAADRAGLRVHDIILSIDGETPVTAASLRKFLTAKKPKDKVRVTYLRGGRKRTATVELDGQEYYSGNNHPLPPFNPIPAPLPTKIDWGSAFQRDNNQIVVTPPSAYLPRYNVPLPQLPPNIARTGYVAHTYPEHSSIRVELRQIQKQIQRLLDRLDQARKPKKPSAPNIEKPTRRKKRDY